MLIKTRANKYQWHDFYLTLITRVSSEVLCSSSFLWRVFIFSVWRGSCQNKNCEISPSCCFFTLSYIKVREGSLVQRGHNHLNHLSKWTMEWLHQTNRCHICGHRGSLGSHTSVKRKKRKMSPLTHFTEEAGQFYRSPRPSLSISCLGEGGHAHFDSCELSGFLSTLLLGSEWQQLTTLSCSSF